MINDIICYKNAKIDLNIIILYLNIRMIFNHIFLRMVRSLDHALRSNLSS